MLRSLSPHDIVTFSHILLSHYCTMMYSHWIILIVTLLSHVVITLCLSRLLLTLCLMITVYVTYPTGKIKMCFADGSVCAEGGCDEMVDGIFAVCNDCRKYITCRGGSTRRRQCPRGKQFNAFTRKCQPKSPYCYPCSGRLHIIL